MNKTIGSVSALLALSSISASADIAASPVSNIELDLSSGCSTNIDMNGDGNADFTVGYANSSGSIVGMAGNQVCVTQIMKEVAMRFPRGDAMDVKMMIEYSIARFTHGVEIGAESTSTNEGFWTRWIGEGTFYAGVKFEVAGRTNLGWMLFSLPDSATGRLVRCAWESAPGAGVRAGHYAADVLPSIGSPAGGNTVLVTNENGYFGAVTNVLISEPASSPATILDHGVNWVAMAMPPATNSGSADIVIQTSDSDYVTLPVAYTYAAPGLSVLGTNGTAVAGGEAANAGKGTDFGIVFHGSALTNTFAIANGGNVTLTISGVTTTGVQNSEFSVQNMPSSVTAGGASNFNITFCPPSEGVFTAAVQIVSDSGVSPFILNLAGEGASDKQNQIIDFPAIPTQRVTNSFKLNAMAASGLPVVFEVAEGPALITNNVPTLREPVDTNAGYWISFIATGMVSVAASQDGSADWNPAPTVTNTFRVIDRVPQGTDFGGEGVSDIAVYCEATGRWYAWSLEGGLILWEATLGGPGFYPVPGDFNGDGRADLAVYNNGLWFAQGTDGTPILNGAAWGGAEFTPLAGDYDGDGIADLMVYHEGTGGWYCRTAAGALVLWAERWGGPGFAPVAGDYRGAGRSDMAIYGGGWWFIRGVDGEEIVNGASWGGNEFTAVPGDYDGNGVADLAVYHQQSGLWFIVSLDGTLILWGAQWGGPGFEPVPGDYSADGISDLAVYANGYWYIRGVDGVEIMFGGSWGGEDYAPVGR